ncbi:hypothetical protein [Metabacillus sp. 84]|uniref:hypothetical protein n=1 Tax=unclassified Metabacillus TaxID=2675274 RepID=UPI003CF5B48C
MMRLEVNIQPSAEAAVLIYKTDIVGDFLKELPETEFFIYKNAFKNKKHSSEFEKAAKELMETEKEIKKIGTELQSEMNRRLIQMETAE